MGREPYLASLLKADPDAEYAIAIIYAGLGEKQRALHYLEQSRKTVGVGILKTDPRLDNLCSDPK